MKASIRLFAGITVLVVNSALLSACSAESSGTAPAAPSSERYVADAATPLREMTGFEPFERAATIEELAPRVAEYTATPTDLLIREPVTQKAEPGKHLAILYTGVPIGIEFYQAMKEAAELLGWRVTGVTVGTSPEEIAAAYDRAITLDADMVIGSGTPREYIAKQLDQLADMEIPVIEWSSGIEPVDGALYVAIDDPLYKAAAIQTAEFLAADGNMNSQIVGFSVSQYRMIDIYTQTINQYMPTLCPECRFDLQQVSASEIGKLGAKVTAYLSRHPDTQYVLCGFGDLCQGVGTALKAAGRSDVKIITRDPASTNYQNMSNGLEWAAAALPIGQTSWQVIDLAQRVFNGQSLAGTRLQPQQILTKVSDAKSPLNGAVPDYMAQYKKLWGLTD